MSVWQICNNLSSLISSFVYFAIHTGSVMRYSLCFIGSIVRPFRGASRSICRYLDIDVHVHAESVPGHGG